MSHKKNHSLFLINYVTITILLLLTICNGIISADETSGSTGDNSTEIKGTNTNITNIPSTSTVSLPKDATSTVKSEATPTLDPNKTLHETQIPNISTTASISKNTQSNSQNKSSNPPEVSTMSTSGTNSTNKESHTETSTSSNASSVAMSAQQPNSQNKSSNPPEVSTMSTSGTNITNKESHTETSSSSNASSVAMSAQQPNSQNTASIPQTTNTISKEGKESASTEKFVPQSVTSSLKSDLDAPTLQTNVTPAQISTSQTVTPTLQISPSQNKSAEASISTSTAPETTTSVSNTAANTSSVSSPSTSTSPVSQSGDEKQNNSANKFSIFFINDLQYDIFPVHSDGTVCEPNEDASKCFGGIGRLSQYIKNKRNKESLWLNAGNFLYGNWFKMLKYETASKVMKLLDFNFVTMGSNAFQYGREASEMFLKDIYSQVLISNIDGLNVKKSGEFLVGKCNVSVIGFVDDSKQEAVFHGVTINNVTESVKKEINEIHKKKQNASKVLIIAFGSTNRVKANEMASTIDGINFLLYSGNCNDSKNQYCLDVVNKTNTPLMSLGMNHSNIAERFHVGEVQISLTDSCGVGRIEEKCFDYSNYSVSDPKASEILADLFKLNNSLTENTMSKAGNTNDCVHSECSLGNLFTDAMIASLNSGLGDVNASRIAVLPSMLFQANRTLIKGRVTATELYGLVTEDPFIYSVALTGKELHDLFEISVLNTGTNRSNFLHVSDLLKILHNVSKDNITHIVAMKTVPSSGDSMKLTSIDLQDNKKLYNVTVPFSLFNMDSYKKIFRAVNESRISFHDMTVIEAVIKYINNTESLSFNAVGFRQFEVESPVEAPQITCASHTGVTVIVTLVLTVIFVGASYGIWRYIIKRRRGRSGSTMAMINLD